MTVLRRPLLTDTAESTQTRSRMRDGELILAWRRRSDIEQAVGELWDFVWYYRKIVMIKLINEGLEAVPEPEQTKAILQAMRKVEEKYGKEILPQELSDFEWGFLQGKLSALNWVMGWQWDMLDT